VILSVPSHRQDGVLLIEVRGDLDRVGSLEFRQALPDLLAGSSAVAVSLDLEQVGFIDCAGARSLLWAADRAATEGRRLTVVRPSARVLRLLRLLEFDRHLLIEQGTVA
jgi:anti-anti-sigma factor